MTRPPLRRVLPAAVFALAAGCSPAYDGVSESDKLEMARTAGAGAAKAAGVKMTQKDYPPHGKAWLVDMSKMTVTDDLLRQVKSAGYVSELNLSGSTLTDEQLGLINEIGLADNVLKFDLSNTGITDAGFEKLTRMALLSDMNLTGTKVTRAAVDQFLNARKANPNVNAMFKKPRIRL